MNIYRTSAIILGTSMLWACSSSPPSQPADQPAPVQTTQAAGGEEDAGLGPIVYNGQSLAECSRQVRTGTRIRRDVCKPNALNGLFPGGVHLSTGGESQPGYGRQ